MKCTSFIQFFLSLILVANANASQNSESVVDDALIGQVFDIADNEGGQLAVRIDAVERDGDQPNSDVFLYTLSAFNSLERVWQNVCRPGPDGLSKAVFMQGHWNAQGQYVESAQLSFGCTSGVLAKCVRWGYKPWLDTPELPMKQLHQACSHLARADYCGNGVGHTKDGTAINVFDVFGIQSQDAADGMKFEAAWNAQGAIAIEHGRYAPADQIRAECPDRLQQHNVNDGEPLPMQELQRLYPNALMFNESYVQLSN